MSVRSTNGIWIADEDSLPHLSAPQSRRPPIKLLLSLAGRCNLRCFHCLGSSDELVRSSQDTRSASRELIDFIVDRVMPDVRALRLGGIGLTEELTSETFDYFMQRIEPHAPHLGSFDLITNLSLMTVERADRLASSLTEVQISIEGVGDNFTRLRGFPWTRLVEHVGMLREARQRNPASRMKLTLLVCAMSDMLDDLLRFDVFKGLGADRIILRELHPLVAQHEPHVLYREPERTRAFVREFRRRAEDAGIDAVITIADRYDAPAPPGTGTGEPPPPAELADASRGVALRRCTLPFEVLSVVHTGQFGVCCYVTDLAGPAPSLSTLNIMDVWNSPSFVAFRKAVNSASPPNPCLFCEVKVGHLSEAEKATVQLPIKLGAAMAERDARRAEAEALREHVRRAEADRSARLAVIHEQGRRLGEVEAERNILQFENTDLRRHLAAAEAERAARLDVIQEQGHRLGEVEAERNILWAQVGELRRHLDAAEEDRAARLEVIRDLGRRLGEAQLHITDLREDAAERRQLIQVLTHRVQTLDERLRNIEGTRMYRWLRRLGRWQFAAEDPPRSPGARS